eukprot:4984923-Pyramimonas_sp.AAC.1
MDEFYTAPTQVITDNSVLVTVAEGQRGDLPTWGSRRDMDTTETYHVPLCSADEDDSDGLDSDEHGQYVELCFTADMSEVVLPCKIL